MKRFLLLLMSFFAILATMLYGFDYVLNINLPKLYLNRDEIKDSNLAIMGSSRAWVQISPKILDSILHVNSFNLGIDGCNADMQILKYNNAYRANGCTPKYIIYCIDNYTLGKWNGYCKEKYSCLFSNDLLSKQIIMRNDGIFSFSEKYLPCCKYSFHMFTKLIPYSSLYKGYEGQSDKWDGTELEKIDSITFDTDSIVVNMFDNYLQERKNEGVKVIFVYPPYYIGAIQKFNSIGSMFSFYNEIAKRHNIPILNYTYDKLSYDTAYFYNALHLNKTGAELFTTKLAHDLDSLKYFK